MGDLAIASEEPIQERLEALEAQVMDLRDQVKSLSSKDGVSIVCFSGEWDRLFAAFVIAGGARALGKEVHLFFTFWAVGALRGGAGPPASKTFSQKMLRRMLPSRLSKAPLSKMHFMGIGKKMMKGLMNKEGVDDVDVLMQEVVDLGAHLHLCETSSCLFGVSAEELIFGDRLNRCGVTAFLSIALKSDIVLFV